MEKFVYQDMVATGKKLLLHRGFDNSIEKFAM